MPYCTLQIPRQTHDYVRRIEALSRICRAGLAKNCRAAWKRPIWRRERSVQFIRNSTIIGRSIKTAILPTIFGNGQRGERIGSLIITSACVDLALTAVTEREKHYMYPWLNLNQKLQHKQNVVCVGIIFFLPHWGGASVSSAMPCNRSIVLESSIIHGTLEHAETSSEKDSPPGGFTTFVPCEVHFMSRRKRRRCASDNTNYI